MSDTCNCNCNYDQNTTVQTLEKSLEQLTVKLDQKEEQLILIKLKLTELNSQVIASSKVLPLTTQGLSWDGTPVKIGFIRSAYSGAQTYPLPETLPSNARMVRIIAFHRSGNEGSGREVLYRLWTEVKGEEHVHFLYGWRYPQSAISFQSPEFWFPVDQNNRYVKASTDSRQPSNDHGVYLYISGYTV